MSDLPPSDQQPIHVIVEIATPTELRLLEQRIDDLAADNAQLRKENSGLRRSFYELLERFGKFQRTQKNKNKKISINQR